jgi:uncharacterized membrane protein
MRRPNPWIAVPALIMGGMAGLLGWFITDLSCRSDDGIGCPGWAGSIATLSFVGVTVGATLLLVLVYRSLAEWREKEARGRASELGEDQ